MIYVIRISSRFWRQWSRFLGNLDAEAPSVHDGCPEWPGRPDLASSPVRRCMPRIDGGLTVRFWVEAERASRARPRAPIVPHTTSYPPARKTLKAHDGSNRLDRPHRGGGLRGGGLLASRRRIPVGCSPVSSYTTGR